ncbi:hypothetical protein GOV03_04410 [Candidatus Woesearchaeota archaeon]|nr:hypothetical protein [Candidatus Woesearchaeota archaeon]
MLVTKTIPVVSLKKEPQEEITLMPGILAEELMVETEAPAEEVQKEEPQLVTLDEAVENSDDCRILTDPETAEVIILAHSFLLQEEFKAKNFSDLLKDDTSKEQKGNSVPTVYALAEKYEIPEEYVKKALSVLQPSVEQQLEDIKRFGVSRTMGVTKQDHDWAINQYLGHLTSVLQKTFPFWEFELKVKEDGYYNNCYTVYRIIEEEKEKGIFIKRKVTKRRRKSFVELDAYKSEEIKSGKVDKSRKMNLRFCDPIVLRNCGEEIERITKKDLGDYKVTKLYHYSLKKQ